MQALIGEKPLDPFPSRPASLVVVLHTSRRPRRCRRRPPPPPDGRARHLVRVRWWSERGGGEG
eukprot:7712350-Pyramimonas_sp.AAC.1